MSDICDDAEGVRRLAERGVVFGRRTEARVTPSKCGHCGALPGWRPANAGKEILHCTVCIRKTSPGKSRQTLVIEWNGMN
jgi:hypothetical protein